MTWKLECELVYYYHCNIIYDVSKRVLFTYNNAPNGYNKIMFFNTDIVEKLSLKCYGNN